MEPWRARLRTLLHGEAGTIAHLTRDLSGLVNGVEKFNARQRDQAPTRERHGRCLSRRNRCRLIHPGRNGAHHRLYVRGRLGWPPFSHTRFMHKHGVFRGRPRSFEPATNHDGPLWT